MVLFSPLTLYINRSTCCPYDLNGIFWRPHSFRMCTMGVIASLAFLMFSLCIESNTLFIGTYLPQYLFRNLVSNIWLFLCSPLENVDAFIMFLLLLVIFDIVFCKYFPDQNFQQLYDQIKGKKGNSHHPPIESDKPMKTLQTRQT